MGTGQGDSGRKFILFPKGEYVMYSNRTFIALKPSLNNPRYTPAEYGYASEVVYSHFMTKFLQHYTFM